MSKTNKKAPPPFRSIIELGGPMLDTDSLRKLAQNEPREFVERARVLVEEGELRWGKIRDLQRLFFSMADVQVPVQVNLGGQRSTIMASAFPLLAGEMSVAQINEAYMGVNTIGGELCEDMEDNKKVTTIAGILSEDNNIDRVDEGKPFPLVGAGEEKFQILHKRNGRRMQVTAEMIEENDIAGIVDRLDAIGEIAAELIEEQTLRRAFDIDGSGTSPAEPYVLHHKGVGKALFRTNNNNGLDRLPTTGNRVTNNALADTSDLDNARARLAAMKNSRGKRIALPVSEMQLVVPDALSGLAATLLNSELQPGVENELNTWGPRGQWRPKLLSSPKIDDLSTTAWYLGNFKKQLRRKWKLRFETVTLTGNIQKFLESRIAYQSRTAWDVEVGARDYVYVVQCLSGTTAP